MLVSFNGDIICGYMIFVESTDFYVMVQHVWAIFVLLLIFLRCTNRLLHWEDMQNLLRWFRDIHTASYHLDYVTIVQKHLQATNFLLNDAVR